MTDFRVGIKHVGRFIYGEHHECSRYEIRQKRSSQKCRQGAKQKQAGRQAGDETPPESNSGKTGSNFARADQDRIKRHRNCIEIDCQTDPNHGKKHCKNRRKEDCGSIRYRGDDIDRHHAGANMRGRQSSRPQGKQGSNRFEADVRHVRLKARFQGSIRFRHER